MRITTSKLFMTGGLMYLVAWCISPPLAYGNLYRAFAVLAVLLFFLFQPIKIDRFGSNMIFFLLALAGYMVLVAFLVGDSFTIRLPVYIFFVLMVIGLYLVQNEDAGSFSVIIYFALALCIIWNITTLRALSTYSNVARLLAKNSDEAIAYSRAGVGGYAYIYNLCVLFPIGIDVLADKANRRFPRLLALIFIGTTIITVLEASYFLSIIIILLEIPAYWILKMKNRSGRILALLLLLIVAILLFVYAEQIIQFLYERAANRSIRNKLLSIRDLLHGEGELEDSEFSTRYERYFLSLRYALTHPLFGGLRYSVTGNHSHFLDFAAQYGLLVTLGYIWLVFKVVKRFGLSKTPCIHLSFLCLAIIYLLNPLAFAMGSTLFIVVPIYYSYKTQRSRENG